MLIVSNGAPKTGSTWLRHIVANMITFNDVPDKYGHKAWGEIGRKRSIAPKSVTSFLNEVDYKTVNYLSKNHFYDKETYNKLVSSDNVKVFCIERELKDVVVSYYYHQIRKKTIDQSFEKYYWNYGRIFVHFMNEYQKVWHQPHPNVYVSSYERLKTDFDNECYRVGEFLGLDKDEIDVDGIKTATSMDSMRKKWGEQNKGEKDVKFFRKGIVGDWQNHFDDKILEDYKHVTSNGLAGIDYLKYLILYPLRLKVTHNVQHVYHSMFR